MSELQSWMGENGETDKSLAPKLGVSRVQVSRLRRGLSKPSVPTARRLEEVTAIPAAIFILDGSAN